MLALLTGCSFASKIAEGISNAASDESSSESSSSSSSNSDKSSGTSSITISDNSGNNVTIGSGSWPTSGVMANVPKLNKGNVTSSWVTDEGTMLTIDSITDADATAYCNTIKQQYSNNAVDLNYSGGFTYSGDNGTITVALSYGDSSLVITVSEKK